MDFVRISCKNFKGEFFPKSESIVKKDVSCPHCGTTVRIDFKVDVDNPGSGGKAYLRDSSKKHQAEMNCYSRESAIKCAIQSKKSVLLEDGQGRFVSFLEFLGEQPEFQKK